MSTGVETVDVVDPWLYATLSGVPALVALVGGSIINGASDEPITGKYVVFDMMSNRDVRGIGTVRVQVDCIYLVKAVVEGSNYDPAAEIFRLAQAAVETGSTVTTAAGVLTCIRETTVQYPEIRDGGSWRHVGGTFRIRVNSA